MPYLGWFDIISFKHWASGLLAVLDVQPYGGLGAFPTAKAFLFLNKHGLDFPDDLPCLVLPCAHIEWGKKQAELQRRSLLFFSCRPWLFK